MKFDEIYGHGKQIAILKSAIAKDRVAHAYLFYGMEGIGKRTTAAVFARALNCGAANPPCDACSSCRKAEHKNHPDIFTIMPDGQFIKIGAIKELQEQMRFRPSEGRSRVFVMPEADRMNPSAANALLKTLEEPSAKNILVLATARPQALPMTILSRCQHLRFTPLQKEEVARFLVEQEDLAEEAAFILAASSGGSIGKALKMKSADYIVQRNGIIDHLAADESADPIKRLALACRLGTEREEIVERLEILRTCYRDALVFRETHEKGMLIFQDRAEVIGRMAKKLSGRDMVRNIAMIEAAVSAIDHNANKSLTLEVMVTKLS
jgi:DNA polymerase-3 subunit delta'